MTRCYPARRVAAQDQGGALAPATLSTQAAAVRKRGGGLARRALLTLSLAGHPSMPEGGAIKSLCCAAAGIFLPKPKAHAGVAYPTTSVRGAQKDAASLRSTTAPHAQPVEGYKQLAGEPKFGQVSARRSFNPTHRDRRSGSCSSHSLPITIIEGRIFNHRLHALPDFRDSMTKFNPTDCGLRLGNGLIGDLGNKCTSIRQPCSHHQSVVVVEHRIVGHIDRRKTRLTDVFCNRHHLFQQLRFLLPDQLPLLSPLTGSDPYGSEDRSNRTNRLHPSRSIAAAPRPSPHPPAKRNHQGRQKHPLQQAARAQVNRELFGQHGHPLAIGRGRSMKASSEPVQGVAA